MCQINNEEACVDIYVSISGGDDGDGKLDNPFVNIQDAIAYIAKSKFKLKRVCIYLRGGVYRISSAIRFDFNEKIIKCFDSI